MDRIEAFRGFRGFKRAGTQKARKTMRTKMQNSMGSQQKVRGCFGVIWDDGIGAEITQANSWRATRGCCYMKEGLIPPVFAHAAFAVT